MQPFVHLHSHTEFSLLDGISRLPDMVRRAKELNQPALAITDHGNMYAAILCRNKWLRTYFRSRQYVRSHLFLQRMYGSRR